MRFIFLEKLKILDVEKLKDAIEIDASRKGENLTLEIKNSLVTREFGSTVLIAIITATGTSIGILINNLLKIVHQKAAQKIVIQSKGGQRLEVPSSIPDEKLEMLIQKVRDLDQEEIRISIE